MQVLIKISAEFFLQENINGPLVASSLHLSNYLKILFIISYVPLICYYFKHLEIKTQQIWKQSYELTK